MKKVVVDEKLLRYMDDAERVHGFYINYVDGEYTHDRLRQGNPFHFRESKEYPTFKKLYTIHIRQEKIKQLMNENSTNN